MVSSGIPVAPSSKRQTNGKLQVAFFECGHSFEKVTSGTITDEVPLLYKVYGTVTKRYR